MDYSQPNPLDSISLDDYQTPLDSIDLNDPFNESARKPTGTLDAYGQTITQAVKQVPGYIAASLEGSTPYDSNNLLDSVQATAKKDQEAFANGKDAQDPSFGGLATVQDIKQTAPSLAGSITGMVPTLAGAFTGARVGALAGSIGGIPGAVIGGTAGGIVGAGLGLFGMMRSAENQFVKENIDKENSNRAAQGQAPLTQQESVQFQNDLNATGDTRKMGMAEAFPETVGNLLETAVLATPIGKFGKSLSTLGHPLAKALTAGLVKSAATVATEAGEEEITRQLQNPIMQRHGFPEQTAGETFKQTAIATAPFAAVGFGTGAYQSTKNPTEKADPNIQQQADINPDNNLDLRTDTSVIDSTAVNTTQSPTLHTSSYDQLFQQAESNYGLPAGLLSTMGFHESGFDPNAVSSAGARGVMQFMPATAQEYGIDPHDTPAAINAAGKKMSGLINYYKGDISKAIAAYNFGEGNVDKTIARAGDNWQDELPPETQVYLSRILGGQEATTTQANTNNQYNDNADQISNYDQSNDQQTLASDNNNSLASGLESINTLENPYLSNHTENQNGSQKTDESTNETSTQEKGSLLNTDAPEQSGVTSIVDNAPHDPLVSVIDRNTGTAFNVLQSDLESDKDKLTKHSVKTGKRLLTPILRQDIVDEQTYQQELTDQQKRQNEQTNQQTETQTQDQTGADQSTAVTPSYATAPLLNKRTNQPFKTRKMAEAAIASSSNPTLNKQDHIAVPVDGGFGITPKPNTTQESNDTTAETQSVLSNTGTNAKGITASATNDVAGQTTTAQEVVPKTKLKQVGLAITRAAKTEHRSIDGVGGAYHRSTNDSRRSDEIHSLTQTTDDNGNPDYTAHISINTPIDGASNGTKTNEGKYSLNALLNSGAISQQTHDFLVDEYHGKNNDVIEANNNHQLTADDYVSNNNAQFPNSKGINDSLRKSHYTDIRSHLDQGGKISKAVFDSLDGLRRTNLIKNYGEDIIDAEAINQPSKTKATEAVAPAQELADLSNNDQANKQPWEITQAEHLDNINQGRDPEKNKDAGYIGTVNRLHKSHIVKALSEGKSVPQEVLADYPDLQSPAQATANPINDNADVSKKGENAPSLVNWRTAFKNASDDVFKQNDILRGIADISKSASELDDVVNLLAKIKKDHGLDVASTAYAVFVNKYSSKEAKQKSDDMSEHMRPAKKGENVDTYHQQTIDEFLSNAKKELGADFDGLKPSLINEHYQSIEDHIKDGGKISQAVYDSLETGKQHHFNKTFGAENVIDDGTRQAELDKLNKISDSKLAKDNEVKAQEEKEFADKKKAVAIHQADETVRMAQYDVDHYGASESNQLKLDQAIKSRDALGRADNTTATEKLTTKGTVVADKAESNIQDFGVKLEGAKKFTYTFKEALAEDIDISAVPLSKSFPQPDYDKLIAGGIEPQVAALIAQLRAEIPTKPSKSYRVSKWVAQVTAIREAADHLLNGDLTVEQFIQAGKGKDNYTKYMGDVLAIADSILPSQIRELGNFKLDHTLYVLYSGVKDVWKWSVVNTASKSSWGKQFDSKEEAIAYIKSEISTENTKGESIAKFDRWTERGKPGVVFVGKKIASGKYITLKEFPTSKEALNYTIEHNAELVELLKQKKKDKEIRRFKNNQRVGKDYRNGKNVSAKEFTDTFGFRGVQFGNWVENDRRQQDLNNAYDGLIDLAEVLGIPPKALALNGELGLAFGARGTGGEKAAAAHYEANQVVINLTKAHGAGSLAHEWWHAVDNYFGKQEGSGFLSEAYSGRNPYQVRQEVYQAWTGITDTIKKETKLAKRSAIKDKTKTKDYWSTVIEMTARTFERYIIGKLADQGYENDYLANIIPAPILEKENELDNEDYAYPLQSEMAAVNKAYDKLFAVLETKETDKGTALFSKSTTPVVNPHSKTSLNQAVTKAMDTLFGQGWTNRLMATGKFKVISRDEAVQIAGNQAANAKGFFNSDTDITYLVYDNIEQDVSSKALVGLMLHEISTHSLNLGKSSEAFQDILRRFEALKATNPKVQAAFANVPASTPDEHKVEEALAEYLAENPKSSLAQRLIEWFRQAVRALGKTLPVLERAKFSQWANKLTEAELIGMATSALKSAPDSLQFDNVGRENVGVKLSLSSLKSNLIKDADLVRNIPITRDQWNKDFPDNKVTTPIGDLKLGENQFDKIMKDDRVDYAGLIKPTLENPAYIIKNERGAKVFIKAFVKPDGKIRGFISISYNIDGIDVVVSNHPKDLKYLAKEINSGELLYSSKTIGPPERGTTIPSGPQLSHAGGLDETISQQENNSSNNIKFSRSTPSNTPADNSAMRSFFAPAKGKQALGWLAGFFQRNHLIDFVAKDLPELINYKLLSQEKDNFTNQRENEIGKSYKEMMDKMDKKTMHELGRVQGMATRLVKFDPALADDNTPMTEEELAVYDAYTAMPDSAKEVYATMRDAYQTDLMEKKRALIERIKAFPADRETQAEIIRTIEKHFDQFKEGVYFPLNRDGAVIVKATNAEGDLVIEHVATQADAYKLIKEMQDQGYENTHILGKDAYDRELLASNAANDMAALAHKTISDLKEKSVQGKLTDADFNDLFSEFNQLLINTLPDSSYRKHFIHRKGTLGESTDTLMAYAKTRTSAVKMIASLTYDHQIQAVLNDADKTIKEMDKVPGSDTLAIKSILNELKLREAALKSTEINAMSQVLTSLGFMGALGFNIASAAVNMLQVMGVALPELSGRHSEIEAIKEISAAYKLLFNPATLDKASGFDITKNPHLTAIAKQAMERLASIGKIDLTMTHDSIAAGKNPSYSSNLMTRSLGSAAKYSGYFFHVAEAANRQITGMAAFNLAYQKNGGNFEAAIAEAVDVIDRTQFDYGQGNRARYMMSNTARVLTLFKAYALGMSYYIGRNAYQSMKGETPEVRLQARKTLVASMAMSFATAGLFGMPIGIEAFAGIGGVAAFKYKGAKFAVPGAIGGMLIFQALLAGLGADDEDELETEFRNWLTDNFDQTTAEWVTKGPARLLPIGDISGRTSLSELWWRSQNKQLEGTDQYNAIATALIGPIGSQIAGLFTAKKMYEDGQYSRMVESMSPAFMRNAIAATRMSQDGVRNLKGDKIIERDLTPVELINKVIGFNPTVVTNTYDANSAIAKESTKHTLAKSHLVNRWLSGNATERSDLMKGDIKDFNESVSPSERINLKNLFASMKARKGIDKHTQNGLYLSKKQNYLRDIGRFNRQE